MSHICICNSGPPTVENVVRSLDRLDNSIQSRDSGSAGQDPSCLCDPCLCPNSDSVPCNANVLEAQDISNRGLLNKLSGLVRQARLVQATHHDCDCADRPPYVERITAPSPQRPSPQRPGSQPPSSQSPGSQPPSSGRRPSDQQQPVVPGLPEATPSRPFVPTGVTFWDLPAEVRNMIYTYYFQLVDPIRTIAAVRFRQGQQGQDQRQARLWRNYQPRNRPWRRRVDPARLPENERPSSFNPNNTPIWMRETATFTYEPAATDQELQQLAGHRLNLLNVGPDIYREAAPIFYAQNFHFTNIREENRIPQDYGAIHSIVAAEAFLRNRRSSRAWIRAIELDMWDTGDPAHPGREFLGDAMEGVAHDIPPPNQQLLYWANDVDRLRSLATSLNALPSFQHLRLNFRNRAPSWHYDGVFDPRNAAHFTEHAYYASWIEDLVTINPQDRLTINMTFRFRAPGDDLIRRRVNDAIYFIRILRNYLLTNAQALNIGYQGIRVRRWNLTDDHYDVIIESDDQWVGGNRSRHVFHLVPPQQLGINPGDDHPDDAFMAQDRPPAEVPRPPPPPPPQRVRQRVLPQQSALDESDDDNA